MMSQLPLYCAGITKTGQNCKKKCSVKKTSEYLTEIFYCYLHKPILDNIPEIVEIQENKVPEIQEIKIPEIQEIKIPESQEIKVPELTKNKEKRKPYDNTQIFDRPDECPICFNSLADCEFPMDCGHWCHRNCIEKWCNKCPVCLHVPAFNIISSTTLINKTSYSYSHPSYIIIDGYPIFIQDAEIPADILQQIMDSQQDDEDEYEEYEDNEDNEEDNFQNDISYYHPLQEEEKDEVYENSDEDNENNI